MEDHDYLLHARVFTRRAYTDLVPIAEDLPDNTLGGLARTLVGLIADGADPRQTVAIQLMDVTEEDGEATTYHETTDYTIQGDGTTEEENIALVFDHTTLEQL